MRNERKRLAHTFTRRALALLLTLAMTLAVFPPIEIWAATQDATSKQIVFDATSTGEYNNKPIVINETTMERGNGTTPYETTAAGRYDILIKGSPFSVTVQGLTNVDITFQDVTIDRSGERSSITIGQSNISAFQDAAVDLAWVKSNTYYVPTCPFLITDGAEVIASFGGTNNVFKAGGNGWYVSGNNLVQHSDSAYSYTNGGYYANGGYAGIQIDGDSSLTIQNGKVEAWGAYQTKSTIAEAIASYPNDSTGVPSGVKVGHNIVGGESSGGAGIGGGISYDIVTGYTDDDNKHGYTQGTPGNITINGGDITAVGGYMAAGLGGGANGAATTGTITINGDPATSASNRTKLLVVGGCWSAGIGEGDSITGFETSCLKSPYSIVINGGAITSYGGKASAAIGTTDNVKNYDGITSGLSIQLNGGDITAISGKADDDNINATAAIGAGQNTDMNPYSITIAEGAIVKASSFSKYAISHAGTDPATVPQTVIDPNTYMYLAYYGNEVVSTAKREFKLYQIKRTELGDFMLVNATDDLVLPPADKNATDNSVVSHPNDHLFFGYEEATQHYYLVDANGNLISDEHCAKYYLVRHTTDGTYGAEGTDSAGNYRALDNETTEKADINAKLAQMTDGDPLSYYFIEPALKTFEVPASYTAVAMTLYAPEVFGGKYIFHVPGTTEGDVYAVIEKKSSGESSGEIKAVTDPHFKLANPGPVKPGNSAVNPDLISEELTNLQVQSSGKKQLGLTDADQIFAPGTKSYNVWLPVGATSFTVQPSWQTTANVTYNVTIRQGAGSQETIANDGVKTYSISAGQTIDVWVEKKDSDKTNSVIYKLSIRVKSRYYLTPTDVSKTYDGTEVGQGIDYMLTTSGTYNAANDVTSLLDGETVTYTYQKLESPDGTADAQDLGTTAPTAAGSYRVTAKVNATEFEADGYFDFVIAQRPITIIGIENWRYYLEDIPSNVTDPIPITYGTGTNTADTFYSGAITFVNVVEYATGDKDTVTLETAQMMFKDSVASDLVDDKIYIYATLPPNGNYTFNGYTPEADAGKWQDSGTYANTYWFAVQGQVTYKIDGAMFAGPLDGETTWVKYYPVIDFDNATEDQLKNYLKFDGSDARVDYHSPDNQSHAEYIYVRSVNEGEDEARYAVDITYGNMVFQYTKTIWDVNKLDYEKIEGATDDRSVWMDPSSTGETVHSVELMQNYILIENRSNRDITFNASAFIDTHSRMIGYDSSLEFDDAELNKLHRVGARLTWGITADALSNPTSQNSVFTGSTGAATTSNIAIPAAAARASLYDGLSSAEVRNKTGYMLLAVKLLGIPSTTETVGRVTITVLPTSQ